MSRRYRILRCVGVGGFGRVYEAEMTGAVARRVALKVHQEAGELPAERLARFRDEARLLARLRHPVIVPMLDLVHLPIGWTMVLEWIDGVDVADLVRQGPLPPRVVASIVADVSHALLTAWESPTDSGEPLRLIHRDLKPQNLRVTPNGHVHLLDLGAARAAFAEREAQTQGWLLGTIAYMAPERLGRHEESPKGDVYSLGLVALDLLRGEPRAAVRMSERGRDGLMRRLGAELGQVAPELEAEEQADVLALVEAMIAWEPDDRLDMTAAHERASALVDRLQGPRPRAWLAENVRRVQTSLVDIEDDAWVGQEIAEDPPTQPAAPPPPAEPARRASSLPWLLGSVLTAAVALWIGSRAVEPDDAARPTPVEPELPPSAPAPEAPATPPEVIDLPAPVQPPKARRSPGLSKTADPPAEPPAAPPAEPPPSEDASVSLAPSGDQGDISARRDGGSRRIQLPGALSPGSWRLFIGSSDAGPLEVRPGEAIVIECKRAFGTCRRR